MPKDPFGSMMITNIGSLGLDTAYVPLVPYSRVPILLAHRARSRTRPSSSDGKITVGKMMRVNATFDHRFIDGFHAASMSRILRDMDRAPLRAFRQTRLIAVRIDGDDAADPRRG